MVCGRSDELHMMIEIIVWKASRFAGRIGRMRPFSQLRRCSSVVGPDQLSSSHLDFGKNSTSSKVHFVGRTTLEIEFRGGLGSMGNESVGNGDFGGRDAAGGVFAA